MSDQSYRLLYTVRWWRQLPYGYWVERDGAFVLFDRNYCPIFRLKVGEPRTMIHPLERIRWVQQRWFYEDASAPFIDPETLLLILLIAELCGLGDEMDYRWALSHHGRIPPRIWGKRWKPR